MVVESQDRLMLPWTSEGKESLRFKSILVILFLLLLIFSIWIPTISLPEKDRETLEKLPPQLAKFVKKKELPKPVKKVEPKKKEEIKVEKKPEPKKEPPKKPQKKKPVKINKPKPQVKAKTPELKRKVKAAREVAKKTGLLALQDELADLRTTVDVSTLSKKLAPRKAKTIAVKAEGSNSQQILARSSGIQTETLSAPAEIIALQARSGTELDETVDEKALAKAEADAASRIKYRSEKSINLIVERLKGSLIALYNRERRKDPFLEGMLMVEVIIEPSGSVSSCRVISSELNHKVLEKKMQNRIYLTDFGAEDVVQTTKNIPFNFGL